MNPNFARTRVGLGAACLAIAVGCGGGADGWYDDAADLRDRREARMEELQEGGMDYDEATSAWGLERTIEETTGRTPHRPLEGEDLRRLLDDH